MPSCPLYLASASPRRAQLLQQIAVPFARLAAPDIDETPAAGESPLPYVRRMAQEKAQAGLTQQIQAQLPAGWVLGADTAVVLGEQILGKPADGAEAAAMLAQLNGREHQVISALALISNEQVMVEHSITLVRFRQLGEEQLQRYVDSGEGADKAGGYGIQGLGAALVESVNGSYSGVVGLPLETLVSMLDRLGLPYWSRG